MVVRAETRGGSAGGNGGSHTQVIVFGRARPGAILRLRVEQTHPRLAPARRTDEIVDELRNRLQQSESRSRYIALLNLSARLPTLGCVAGQREVAKILSQHALIERDEVSIECNHV